MAEWNQGGVPEDFAQSSFGVGKAKAGLTWSELLRQTYALYRDRFKTLFLISLPPATCAYFCFFLQRIIIRALRAQGWMPSRFSPQASIVFTLVALFEGAIYWIISAAFFAAVASNVLQKTASEEPIFADAFTHARRRLGALIAVALTIWAPFVAGRAILGFALWTILERLGLFRNIIFWTVTYGIVLLLLAGLLTRLGLAIPVLIGDSKISVSQSLRLSIRKTENWEPFFIVFLAKTAILGYSLYWVLRISLSWVYQFAFPHEGSRFWLESVIYIGLASALESPLFIAFSLLYQHSKITQEEPRAAAAIG
jgi:hypothetical protein